MYAVAGASGHTGSVVASTLLAKGKEVRVIVHHEDKGIPWKARGAEVFVANLDDGHALGHALNGVEGLYYLVPPSMKAPDPNGYYRRFLNTLVDVLKTRPLVHAVYLSTWTVQHLDTPFPMHRDAEHRLRNLDTPFTFLRASFFMENFESMIPFMKEDGVLHSFFPPSKRIPMVAVHDVGRIAALALMEGRSAPKVVELTGPEDYSTNDAAEAYGKALGRTVRVEQIPESAIADTMVQFGASYGFAEFYRNMIVTLAHGDLEPEAGIGAVVHGTTTLEEAAGAMVSPRAILI